MLPDMASSIQLTSLLVVSFASVYGSIVESDRTGLKTIIYNASAGTSPVIATLFPPPETQQSLFFTSPGGSRLAANDGLYGLSVDYRTQTAEAIIGSRLPVVFDCVVFVHDDDEEDYFRFKRNYNNNNRNRQRLSTSKLRVRSMSYDSLSGFVLFDVVGRDDFSLTLVRGRPCPNGDTPNDDVLSGFPDSTRTINCSLDDVGRTVLNASSENDVGNLEVLFYNAKIPENSRVGPFAYHDLQIYFLLQRFERPDYRTKLNVIELRRMLPVCADGRMLDVPVTATSSVFDMIDCSTVVANVTQEEYDSFHSYRPLNTLIVVDNSIHASGMVQSSKSGRRLDFYFQLQRVSANNTTLDINVILYHATSAKEVVKSPPNGDATPVAATRPTPLVLMPSRRQQKPLQTTTASPVTSDSSSTSSSSAIAESWSEVVHDQPVGSGHLKYVLVQLGGIDHRHSTLCWAAVDRILCGRRSPETGQIDEIQIAVDVGQASVACRVEDREVAVYFGCAAQIRGFGGHIGGAGLVRLPAYDVWPARITPLMYGREPSRQVYAGAMFVVDRCSTFSSWNVDSVRSGSQTTTTEAEAVLLRVTMFVLTLTQLIGGLL